MTNPTSLNASPDPAPEFISDVRQCPRCGLTETMLRTEGLLGCTTCYETFSDLVVLAVSALHGVTISPASNSAAMSAPVAAAAAPEVSPPTVPTQRKTLSWLPRLPKQGHLSPSEDSLTETRRKKKRSAE